MSETTRTERRRSRLAIGGLAAALVVACGGTAVGATLVTSKTIKNDTIKRIDLAFETGQDASSVTGPVKVNKDQQQIVDTTLTVDDEGGSGIAQGFLELRNPTSHPATISVVLVHQQEPAHTSSVTATLKVGESTSVPVGLLCDGLPAGEQTVQLKVVGATDLIVESAFLSAIASPGI